MHGMCPQAECPFYKPPLAGISFHIIIDFPGIGNRQLRHGSDRQSKYAGCGSFHLKAAAAWLLPIIDATCGRGPSVIYISIAYSHPAAFSQHSLIAGSPDNGHPPVYSCFKYFFRYCPVKERGSSATSSGVPCTTTVPPPEPPSGPMSIR